MFSSKKTKKRNVHKGQWSKKNKKNKYLENYKRQLTKAIKSPRL